MSSGVAWQALPGGVALLRLSRPEARNALTLPMVAALRRAVDEIDRDVGVRVVVVAGEGKGFCAGLDVKEAILGEDAPGDPIAWMALQEAFAGTVLRLRRMRQPIVAAIQGAAVGAGFGLALAADVRVADPSALFLVGAVKIGLSAGECGISYHLPRLVGAGRAFEIMLTGRGVGAEEALAIGLVSRIVGADAVLDMALDLARQIAGNSPYAVKHTKQVMWSNLEAPGLEAAIELENHVQTVALATADFREGVRAFAEKRAATFTGH